MATEYQRRKVHLQKEEHKRLLNIINERVGKWRRFKGEVRTDDFSGGQFLTDEDVLHDMRPQMEEGSAMALWTDGSRRLDEALGAGVVWRVEEAVGWGWKEMEIPLGRKTGASEDAELHAIAAAADFAAKEVEEGSPIRLVRIFSDCARVLKGIERGTLTLLGPAVSSPWAIEVLYDSTDFLVKRDVKVQLVWVKGHAQSEGNNRADVAARNAARKAAEEEEKKGWETRDSAPQAIKEMGEDSVEEWFWRMNRLHLLEGKDDDTASQGSADMNVSDEDLSNN